MLNDQFLNCACRLLFCLLSLCLLLGPCEDLLELGLAGLGRVEQRAEFFVAFKIVAFLRSEPGQARHFLNIKIDQLKASEKFNGIGKLLPEPVIFMV